MIHFMRKCYINAFNVKRIFHFFRILMLLLIFEPLQADDVRGMFFYHQRLDDLRQNITKAKNPEEKIRNYLLLSKMYQIISADKASAYADSAIFLSHSAELHSLEADALLLKARVYMIGYVTD